MSDSKGAREAGPAGAVARVREAVEAALTKHVAPGVRVSVGLSGGVDSMVLLDAASICAQRHSIVLSALHVNHGISPNADRWTAFCAAQCAARNLPLVTFRPRVERRRGQSLEAIAREARYECLLAADVDVVLLAHHADDQAETLLLQLLRGAGPHGLAAMPSYRAGRPALLRPLLGLTRAMLVACAKARALEWIDDESNADSSHARNYLRREISPLIRARFSGYPRTLVRAAEHQSQAAALLDDLAALDASGAIDRSGLDRERVRALSPERGANLLRWFMRREGLRPPSQTRLSEMMWQLLQSAADAKVSIAHQGRELGLFQGRIVIHERPPEPYVVAWNGESEVRLPGGALAFVPARGAGLCADVLERAPVSLRSRMGGERIQLAANRPHHAVKKLLQQARMPPWERAALPLVWCGDDLAAVPGVGVAVGFQAALDKEGWTIAWVPDSPEFVRSTTAHGPARTNAD